MADKENTYRALKDLPRFVDRWQCRVGWHRWGLWSNIETLGNTVMQTRYCVDCNRHEVYKKYYGG